MMGLAVYEEIYEICRARANLKLHVASTIRLPRELFAAMTLELTGKADLPPGFSFPHPWGRLDVRCGDEMCTWATEETKNES